MERDFGLNSLSEVERNVLYAIKDLEKEKMVQPKLANC